MLSLSFHLETLGARTVSQNQSLVTFVTVLIGQPMNVDCAANTHALQERQAAVVSSVLLCDVCWLKLTVPAFWAAQTGGL